MIETLIPLLRAAVNATIELATSSDIGPALPAREYAVRWYEPVSVTQSLPKFEIRSEPSFDLLRRHLGSGAVPLVSLL